MALSLQQNHRRFLTESVEMRHHQRQLKIEEGQAPSCQEIRQAPTCVHGRRTGARASHAIASKYSAEETGSNFQSAELMTWS